MEVLKPIGKGSNRMGGQMCCVTADSRDFLPALVRGLEATCDSRRMAHMGNVGYEEIDAA